jgi:hypothetical protein
MAVEEVGAFPGNGKGRTPVPGFVADLRALDLDGAGAEISQIIDQ